MQLQAVCVSGNWLVLNRQAGRDVTCVYCSGPYSHSCVRSHPHGGMAGGGPVTESILNFSRSGLATGSREACGGKGGDRGVDGEQGWTRSRQKRTLTYTHIHTCIFPSPQLTHPLTSQHVRVLVIELRHGGNALDGTGTHGERLQHLSYCCGIQNAHLVDRKVGIEEGGREAEK